MGSGVAKMIRAKYPGAYKAYRDTYEHNGLSLGQIIVYEVSDDLTIVNAVTQEFYGRSDKVYVDYEAIYHVFDKINKLRNGRDVHFPLIGCGLANGDWSLVSEIIIDRLDDSNDNILWTL